MKMTYQNWETQKIFEGDKVFSVKINTEIADTLFERKLILKMKEGYPWVVRPASSSCSSCASSSPPPRIPGAVPTSLPAAPPPGS